jgi:transposase
VAPKGPAHVARIVARIEEGTTAPPEALAALQSLVSTLKALKERIDALDVEIATRAKQDETARRLMSVPGIGPVIATAIVALAPAANTFENGRHFTAWLGLVPRQHSSGGNERLGRTTKMGDRSLRRLLIIGANAVVRWAVRNPPPAGSWLAKMLARKPRQLVTVALAGKMARIAWALMAKGGVYRASGALAA